MSIGENVYLIRLCIDVIQKPYNWDLFGQGKKDN